MKLKSYIEGKQGNIIIPKGSVKKSGARTITFIIIVSFSLILWSINYLQSRLQMTVRIPINYENIETKYQPKQKLPKYIVVEVKDRVINLLRCNKDVVFIPKEQKIGNLYKLTFDDKTIKDFVTKNLPSSSEIINITPSKLEIPLILKYSRKVPIKKMLDIDLKDGYVVCDTKFSEDEITIYGDRDIIKNIDSVGLVLPKEKDIHKDIDIYADLILPKGVTSSIQKVRVNANVEVISQMDLTLPINIVGLPSNLLVHTLPSNAKISISLPISKLKELKNNKDFPIESQIVIGVVYNEDFNFSENNSIEVELIEKPKWIMDYRITPSKVQYIIEKING